MKAIAVGSWRSTLVPQELSPQLPAPIKEEPEIRHGAGRGAWGPGAQAACRTSQACPPCLSLLPQTCDFISPPVGPDGVSGSLRSVGLSPCFQADE